MEPVSRAIQSGNSENLGASPYEDKMQNIRTAFDEKIETHLYNYYWESLGLFDWQERIEKRKNEVSRSKAILDAVESISNSSLEGKKMLDIGCGWGGFVVAGLEKGIDSWGCDVDEDVLEIARLRSNLHQVAQNFVSGTAEKLPFKDEEFDYVQSITVLEHVNDVGHAVKELVRVLKKGGMGFIQAPNYWQPIERHYKILYPPKCPRVAGKIYLKLLGRPAKFIDTINYIDYGGIKRLIEKCGAKVDDIESAYSNYFKNKKMPQDISIPINKKRTYNSLITKLMWRITPPILSFYENVLGIRQIYFLIRK
jgi:ubiquinone/menaquinone biosynthesis C-methylase UbiE